MAKSRKGPVKFEDALLQLEKIVEELEGGNLTLDQSLARYEEGVRALRQCYEILRSAEKKVEILLQSEDGTLKTEPFEPEPAEPTREHEAPGEASEEAP